MRIAIVTHVGRLVGGVESYLAALIPALRGSGHEVALWYEEEGPLGQPAISDDPEVPRWNAAALGLEVARDALRGWGPDVVFSHGLQQPHTERLFFDIAPCVLFDHAYQGACISGWKSRLAPKRAPCARPLGWPCLLHYLPRRCGGLNPLTMLQRYEVETQRRDALPAYRSIVTASAHMRREYRRYVARDADVHAVDLMIEGASEAAWAATLAADSLATPDLAATWRLLFMGRLTELKGVGLLIDAIPHLRRTFNGQIVVTVLGDGPARATLERRARRLSARMSGVTIAFMGWQDASEREAYLRTADLLVVPSVWPEPFGLVGPEAGLLAVPAVAFAVGGIPAWLQDGVNGHLAQGRTPRAARLATAIARSLSDPTHHARLRRGAREAALRFTTARHLAQLMPILERAAAQ